MEKRLEPKMQFTARYKTFQLKLFSFEFV